MPRSEARPPSLLSPMRDRGEPPRSPRLYNKRRTKPTPKVPCLGTRTEHLFSLSLGSVTDRVTGAGQGPGDSPAARPGKADVMRDHSSLCDWRGCEHTVRDSGMNDDPNYAGSFTTGDLHRLGGPPCPACGQKYNTDTLTDDDRRTDHRCSYCGHLWTDPRDDVPCVTRDRGTPPRGTRVALHPATDEWMSGDRYGTVVGVGRAREYRDTFTGEHHMIRPVRVKLDRSGRVRRFHPENVSLL